MTELTITPKIADKTARFKGAVAAGEHVAVTIKGGAAWLGDDNGEHLSLRVLDLVTGRTLAVFPRPEETYGEDEEYVPDEWSTSAEDPNDLFCNLNLNTDRMVNAARHMLRVPVLFVMGAKDEDNPATTRTLYFRDRHEVEFWPERVGDDTPYDLDRWPKRIDEWQASVDSWTERMDNMKLSAEYTPRTETELGKTTITLNDGNAAQDTVVVIHDGADGEVTPAQLNAAIAGVNAGIENVAEGLDAHAGNGDIHVTSLQKTAWSAKYDKPNGGIPKTDLASAVQTSLGKADTALQAHQSLDAYVNGGDYDSTSKKILLKHGSTIIAEIDATVFVKDGMVSSVAVSNGNLVITFNSDAGKQPISIPLTQIFNPSNYYDKTAADSTFVKKDGAKVLSTEDYTTAEKQKLVGIADGANNYTLPPATSSALGGVKQGTGCEIAADGTLNVTGGTVDDTVTRTSENPVKSSGIWGAIWGALAALPFGFTSLYDWCKSFFVHVSAIAPKWDAGGTYRVGDVCMEGELPDSSGLLYRCKKAYTATSESDAPSHDTEHWEPIDVTTLIASKQDALSAAQLANIAAVPGKADAADLAALVPKYPMVPVTLSNGTLTVSPYTVATYTVGDSAAAFTVGVGTGTSGVARDCELVIDCTATGAVAPTVTWPSNFHPRTDEDDFACEAGVRNVYYISEYATGEFVVGGWQETTGGNA